MSDYLTSGAQNEYAVHIKKGFMMDQLSTERLASIVSKEAHELTQEDIAFLFARRDYLEEQDLVRFESILSQPIPKLAQSHAPVKLDRMKLIKQAKELGLHFEKTMTAPQLKALIDDAIATAEADSEAPEVSGDSGDQVPADPQQGHNGNFSNSNKYQPENQQP